jgi:DNA mismatch repair protein MutH
MAPSSDADSALLQEARLHALVTHARALVGARLVDLADDQGVPIPRGNVRTKGWAGQIIERELGVGEPGPATGRGPDFAELGVELKTVPVDHRHVPLESTAVCQIDPISIAGESWETSYARRKLERVLFVALLVPGALAPVEEREVVAVRLWRASPAEEAILRADFELFVRDYFRPGRSAELTGHLGRALQVRPKGRNAADSRAAFGPDGHPTRVGKMGFYLRPAFVAAILGGA